MSYSPEIVIGDKISIKNNNILTVFQIRSHSPEFIIFRKKIHIITNDSSVFYKHLKFKTWFINQEMKLDSTILYIDLTKLVCYLFHLWLFYWMILCHENITISLGDKILWLIQNCLNFNTTIVYRSTSN